MPGKKYNERFHSFRYGSTDCGQLAQTAEGRTPTSGLQNSSDVRRKLGRETKQPRNQASDRVAREFERRKIAATEVNEDLGKVERSEQPAT
ncbi:hypothetical protein [Mycobacterium sp. 852002-51057_SCH5723018]|uniref:hypothetical protein n=1 Tax=Mycobacterium sp. 852002-51057_SCH5723018 TaxID=1834094 RepID=UPI000802467C|nr:hypothetical protein [Mycobacterium sp. 852002-51057_SCH5723018]OBG27195.1 hypothetical protein A5764_00450 [Mycobacterium sp. 852002-51057_SCH5723018]